MNTWGTASARVVTDGPCWRYSTLLRARGNLAVRGCLRGYTDIGFDAEFFGADRHLWLGTTAPTEQTFRATEPDNDLSRGRSSDA